MIPKPITMPDGTKRIPPLAPGSTQPGTPAFGSLGAGSAPAAPATPTPPAAPPAPSTGGGGWKSYTPPQPAKAAQTPGTDGLLNQPGALENFWSKSGDFYSQPTQSAQYWNAQQGNFAGPSWRPTTATDAYDKYQAQFGDGPQQGTQGAWDASKQMQTQGFGESGMKNLAGSYQGPGMTQQYVGGLDSFFSGNPVEEERDFFKQGLRDASFSENLLTGGEGQRGIDLAFERERTKSQRALDDAMAARGLFGGEASIRGSIELGQDIAARKAMEMANLAKQADAARLGRTDSARDFAAAGAGEGRQRVELGGKLTGQAEGFDLERKRDLGDLLEGVDRLGLDRAERGARLGLDADAADLDRGNSAMDRAVDMDELSLDGERFALDRIMAGSELAGASDASSLDRLNAGASVADRVQGRFEGRERGALDDIMGATNQASGAYLDQMNRQLDDWFAAEEMKIQAMLDSGEISAEQAQAQIEKNKNMVGSLVSMFAGGGGGGGGGGLGGMF